MWLACMCIYTHTHTHTQINTNREDLPLYISGNKHGVPPSKGWEDMAGVEKVMYIHAHTHTNTNREDLPLYIFGNKHGVPTSKGWEDMAGVEKVIGEFWNMMGPIGEILGIREYKMYVTVYVRIHT
jgi:hypothetical protein